MKNQHRPASPADERHLAWVDVERSYETLADSNEEFDRIAFAQHLLGLVPPKNTTVVLHESYRAVRVESGRDYSRGNGAKWIMFGISPRASRAYIALAVAEIAGLSRVPFIVDLLVAAARDAPSGARARAAFGAHRTRAR